MCRNRDVKVNVNPEQDERPSLRGAGFMRQARTGQTFQPHAVNRTLKELLSASCRIASYWHTSEPLKLCWMRERVTGLLYLEERSSGISLPLPLWAEMVQRVEGICHQRALRWSRGPGRALDPSRRENKTGFQPRAGWYLPCVTLECDSHPRLPFAQTTSLLWGSFRCSRWASEITAVLLPSEKKQDYSFLFSHERLETENTPARVTATRPPFSNPFKLVQRWPAKMTEYLSGPSQIC